MAFPTTVPADGTTYSEDGRQFFVDQGKWAERPGCRFHIGQPAGSNNSVILTLDDKDESTRRILFQATFQLAGGDGYIQFNVKKNGAWLPASGSWDKVGGDLSEGANAWRKGSGDWSSLRAPDGYGIFLNWVESGWGLGSGQRAFCRIEIQQLNDTWSIFHWRLIFMKRAEYPARVIGTGKIKATPKEIEAIRLHTTAYFNPTTMVAESF